MPTAAETLIRFISLHFPHAYSSEAVLNIVWCCTKWINEGEGVECWIDPTLPFFQRLFCYVFSCFTNFFDPDLTSIYAERPQRTTILKPTNNQEYLTTDTIEFSWLDVPGYGFRLFVDGLIYGGPSWSSVFECTLRSTATPKDKSIFPYNTRGKYRVYIYTVDNNGKLANRLSSDLVYFTIVRPAQKLNT